MDPQEKRKSRLGRICCFISSALLLCILISLTGLYYYLQSPAFRTHLEEMIRTRTDREIHIGEFIYDRERGIILRDLVLGSPDPSRLSLIIPYGEIGLTWEGIKRKRIDHLLLRQPMIALPLATEKKEKARDRMFSLPFQILEGRIDEGMITLQRSHAPPLEISAIHLALREGDEGKEIHLEGSGLFGETKTSLEIEGRINPDDLTWTAVHLRTGWSDLATLPAIFPLPDPTLSMEGSLKIDAELQQGDAGLTGTATGNVKDFRIGKNDAPLFKSSAGDLHLRFANTGTGDLHLQATVDTASMQITTREVTVTRKEATRITVEGVYPAQGDRIEELRLKAELPGTGDFLLSGILSELSTKNPDLNLTIQGEKISLKETVSHLSGPSLRRQQNLKIGGELTGQARITGRMNEPAVEGNLRITGGRFNLQGRSTGPLLGETTFTYTPKGLTLPDFTITSRDLGRSKGNLALSLGPRRKLSAAWTQSKLSLARLKARFPWVLPGLKETELHGKGALRTTLTIIQETGKPAFVKGRSRLHLREGGFSSFDGSRMGEGIQLDLATQYDFSLPLHRLRFSFDGTARDFELLLGGFYGNFKEKPLSCSLQGIYHPGKGELRLNKADLTLKKIGTLHASGRIDALSKTPRFDLQGGTDAISLSPFFDFFLRETFQESHPELSKLKITGTTGLDMNLSGTKNRFQTKGALTIHKMNLQGSPSASLEGLDLTLPFELNSLTEQQTRKTIDFGTLSIARLAWGNVQIADLTTHPVIEGNRLHFQEAVTLPLFGGTITLKGISFKDLLNRDRALTLAIDIDDLDLSEGSVALKLPPFNGRVTGTIPEVRLAGRQLTTAGEIRLHLFGGEIRIDKIAADHLFTPIPSLHASIQLRDLDLRRLTGIFEFGRISGILEGEIRDLVITRGQPERFEARIETVPTKGVPQKISVEALEKISILGSGASPTLFGRGIYQLFKEYRYSRMGFRSSLKNDKFILHGIERFGNRGYLVKGSFLPPKVNVINYTQDISFREMVKRLQRISTSGKAKSGADE